MATQTVRIRADWEDRGVARGTTVVNENLDRMHDSANRVTTAQGRMAQSGDSLIGTFGRLGPAIAGAISAAAIAQTVRMATELASLSARAKLTEQTFDRLAQRKGSTGLAELEKLRDAVGGTLSDLRLMQSVGAAVDAGLTFEQSRTAVEFLRRYSLAFGKDFDQLVSTIFTGLQRGSTLMLDDAGIIIDASSKMFQGLGEVEKKSALVAHAIDLMREKMVVLPKIQSDASTESDRLAASWEKLKIEIGEVIDSPIEGFLAGLAAVTDELANSLDDMSVKLDEVLHKTLTIKAGEGVEAFRVRQDIANQNLSDTEFSIASQGLQSGDGVAQIIDEIVRHRLFAEKRTHTDEEIAAAFEGFRSPFSKATPTRDLPLPSPEIITTVTTRLDEGALREINDILDTLTRARNIQPGTETPQVRGLPGDFSPEAALKRFLEDEEIKSFFQDRADALTEGAEAFDQSSLVTISAIENLISQLDFLPQEFQDVASSAASLARALSTKNPFDAISAGLSVVSLVAGIFTSRAQRARQIEEENRRVREAHLKKQEDLNEAIRDATDLTGRFAGSLVAMNEAQLRGQFGLRAQTLDQALGPLNITLDNILSRENEVRSQIESRFGGDDRFDYLHLALNEAVTIARSVEERKAEAEIAAREEQAEVIIDAIEKQRERVLQRLTDAEEAQRAAALRAVAAQFDFVEAELRARYSPQVQSAAGDEAATLVLRERIFADIERLRRGEAAAGEAALQGVSDQFSDARDRTNALYDGMSQAVRDAIPDLSKPFVAAVAEQTQAFLERWDQGLVLQDDGDIGSVIDKLSSGGALTVGDVANLLSYQLATRSELENAKLLNLTQDEIDKLTGAKGAIDAVAVEISKISGIGAQYGTGPLLSEDDAALVRAGLSVILPEGWVSEIPVTGADGVPKEIYVVAPDGLADDIVVTVPDGVVVTVVAPEDLPQNIRVIVPEDLPQNIQVIVPEDLASEISITAPEGLLDDIAIVVPEDLPQNIQVIVPSDMPDGIPVYVPEDLSSGVPVYIPQDVLDLLDSTGRDREEGAPPQDAATVSQAHRELLRDTIAAYRENNPTFTDNDILRNFLSILQTTTAMSDTPGLYEDFLANPEYYGLSSRHPANKPTVPGVGDSVDAGPQNVVAFPEAVTKHWSDTATAAAATRDHWSEGGVPRQSLIDIETNTDTGTSHLSDIKTTLQQISDNTSQPAHTYTINSPVSVTVEQGDLDETEDAFDTLAQRVADLVLDRILENTELRNAIRSTG